MAAKEGIERKGRDGARPVPGRSAREDRRAPGLIRRLRNKRNCCAPGRRALRI